MPRLAGSNKGKSGRVTIRLDKPTEDFYRRKAQEAGVPLAEHCRQLLMRGIIQDNVEQLEKRLTALLALFPDPAKINGSHGSGAPNGSGLMLPAEIVRATFFSQEVLKAIASNQNKQTYYAAQEAAEAETKKLLGAAHV
ncbi:MULTISPECIES: hypothetical protein [Burkholderia]|uniref:hypothetical protein n=1 Tax=Burkholderia TaxID=32008 RepID=UPI000D00C76A|nr:MULTISPECIES: hypothetical protein [Burkholderia]MBU9172290.1 hypothetical protein [Burkholderia gladioli]MBU9177417.1 hypothetical protein [Burkholderia gladioli]MBU9324017.1 hypothetical protein [Burkholderia gladioli]MCA8171488.1 hypothetical protein [Burkholderia gladioli]PRG88478.1 hypothetical protein C6V08_34575 [Burkholderia gladioli]